MPENSSLIVMASSIIHPGDMTEKVLAGKVFKYGLNIFAPGAKPTIPPTAKYG